MVNISWDKTPLTQGTFVCDANSVELGRLGERQKVATWSSGEGR